MIICVKLTIVVLIMSAWLMRESHAEDGPLKEAQPAPRVSSPQSMDESLAVKASKSERLLFDSVRGTDTSAALDSAWELVRRKSVRFRDVRTGVSTPMDRTQLGWFLGVVDSKLPCDVPRWWCKEMSRVRHVESPHLSPVLTRFHNSFEMRSENSPYEELTDPDSSDSDDVSLTAEGSFFFNDTLTMETRFERDDHAGSVSWAVVTGDPNKPLQFSGVPNVFILRGDMLYCCTVGIEQCDRIRLRAIDTRDDTVKWKSSLFAGKWPSDPNPVFSTQHFLDIVVMDDCLYVFGIHEHAGYIECLDVASGVARWRFSTAY